MKGTKQMPLHVLYSPAHSDFVRDAAGKPVVTEKWSPTRADAPADAPAGTHWMQLEDTIYDVGQGSFVGPKNKLGEPVIELFGGRAVRKFPILHK
jgi:hypothetical protein